VVTVKTSTALLHDEFVATLHYFIDNGATATERELARVALDIYELAATEPPVATYVNHFAMKALWS